MPARHILVVAVDGLRAAALGAYGNTSCPTPALDQFAAESLLLDWCYAPAPELDSVYGALWQSTHPARDTSARDAFATLPRLLAGRAYATTLVTDEPALMSLGPAGDFQHCVQVVGPAESSAAMARAHDPSQTVLARLLAAACDVIGASSAGDSRRLVWAHARGMYGPWDAPLELQQSLLDEGDPPPVEDVPPPDFVLEGDDPDAAFRYGCAYAAQVMVLDACWKGVLEAVEAAGGADQWLVMLLGVRGFPLGQHRRVGGVDPRLYGEMLHVPWLVRLPGGAARLARNGRLVSHLDLLPTLLDWEREEKSSDSPLPAPCSPPLFDGRSILPLTTSSRPAWRDALVSVSAAGHAAIRTAEWCLRRDAEERLELYVRPDDRWETNDVTKLCPDVVEMLAREMNETLQRM